MCWSPWKRLVTTGKNLFAALAAEGYRVAVINPLRTRRFAEEDLQRTKTDAIDALGIATFAAPEAARSGEASRLRHGGAA